MLDTVLVANRGEIAVRICRTLRAMGIASVAVYSDADAEAPHVRAADTAVRLGPAPAAQSYLSIERVLAAVRASGADAVHPGYGFLSENAAFARACRDAGVVFIGPSPEAIEAMGDKISAKRLVSRAGVPVVPGWTPPLHDGEPHGAGPHGAGPHGAGPRGAEPRNAEPHGAEPRDATSPDAESPDAELAAAAQAVGYPVLVKPSAGGGGKGMRVVTRPEDLAAALAGARREAAASFGDPTIFLERYLSRPRHIEVQVLADAHGRTLHLGERECSLQRRHQKIIEEAPSALLDPATRDRIGAAAVAVAESVGYTGAGTVEFIVSADAPEEFFFLEMNTRLQVEHPVTECVTGLDLVEWQLRIAAGERLSLDQEAVVLTGHAVEARVYAEDPGRGFLPTGGTVLALTEPAADRVRVDSGLAAGMVVGSTYDPMLSKVIAWAPDRPAALRRLAAALDAQVILGLTTNVDYLRALVRQSDVVAGALDTGLVERHPELARRELPAQVLGAAALLELGGMGGPDPWDAPSGWRPGEAAPLTWRLSSPDGVEHRVEVRGSAAAAQVSVDGGASVAASVSGTVVTWDGLSARWEWALEGEVRWLWSPHGTWSLTETPLRVRERAAGAAAAELRSPMPGTVIGVSAAVGDEVSAGQPVVVVEAMKMEHVVAAAHAGTVTELGVRVGQPVAVDQVLARIDALEQ